MEPGNGRSCHFHCRAWSLVKSSGVGKAAATQPHSKEASPRSPFHHALTLLFFPLLVAGTAQAYPEFEQYVDQTSGRYVNCSLCHAHPEGPEGVKPGQIGSLTPQQMDELNRGRAAFEPGQEIDNPILNEFGNDIIRQLGKTQFLQFRTQPEALAGALDPTSDLDGDSISDVDEFLAGTHPLDPRHGEPMKLFAHYLRERWVHVALLIVATVLGLYGISGFLHGFEVRMRAAQDEDEGIS
jgi:hypothetical protein